MNSMKKTRLVSFYCKKCGGTYKLDIGDASREKIEASLRKRDSFECPGHHVELTSPLNYWEIDWNSLEETEVQSQEEWLNDLKKTHSVVVDTEELERNYEVEGFCYGLCIAKDKTTNKKVTFNFATGPDEKRYYFAR